MNFAAVDYPGERSGMGVTRYILDQTGVLALAEEFGFNTMVYDELEERDWATAKTFRIYYV